MTNFQAFGGDGAATDEAIIPAESAIPDEAIPTPEWRVPGFPRMDELLGADFLRDESDGLAFPELGPDAARAVRNLVEALHRELRRLSAARLELALFLEQQSAARFGDVVPSIDRIARTVCQACSADVDEVRKSKKRRLVFLRWVVMTFATEFGYSHEEIADYFAIDHTSVAYGLKEITKALDVYEQDRLLMERLRQIFERSACAAAPCGGSPA